MPEASLVTSAVSERSLSAFRNTYTKRQPPNGLDPLVCPESRASRTVISSIVPDASATAMTHIETPGRQATVSRLDRACCDLRESMNAHIARTCVTVIVRLACISTPPIGMVTLGAQTSVSVTEIQLAAVESSDVLL